MPSSYKGIELFASGPHRFAEGRLGQVLVSELGELPPAPGTKWIGLGETQVFVTGRLVASSESALWAARSTITAQLLDPPTPGTLADGLGRTWLTMSFVQFRAADRIERGRVWSLSYRARFIRFRVAP
jgi:hypothetical protein